MSAECFRLIVSFVEDLNMCFGDLHNPLKLYARILEMTTFSTQSLKAVEKNVDIFTEFCKTNRVAIRDCSSDKLEQTRLGYSEKAYIDFTVIFSHADSDQMESIWKHLLCISAFVDPELRAKSILEQMTKSGSNNQALDKIINKIQDKIGDDSGGDSSSAPQLGKILNPQFIQGLVQDLLEGVQSGDVDLNQLTSMVNLGAPGLVGGAPGAGGALGGLDLGSLMGQLGSIAPPPPSSSSK